MFLLIFLNLVVGLSSFLLIKYCFRLKDPVDCLLSYGVLFLTQVILTELTLGIINILTANSLLVLNLIILLSIFILIKYLRLIPKTDLRKQFDFLIIEFRLNRYQSFCLAAILGFALVKLAINAINPPFGWDNLNYHFSFPVEWLKNANLDMPLVVSDDPAPSYYPLNGSLIFFWLMVPLKNFFIADLAQSLFFILSFLVVYSLSKKMALSKLEAFFSATLFVSIPNFFKQLEIAYVDIMVAALFLISLNNIFNLRKHFNIGNIILCSCSIGLLIGTKSLACLYGLLLFLPILAIFIKKTREILVRRLMLPAVVFCLMVVLLGGFSYVRNLILSGNPLYPIDIEFFGNVIFKGAIDKVNYAAHFISKDYALSKLLFHEGLGLQTLLFVLPGVLLALPVYILKNHQKDYLVVYTFILPIFIYFAFRYIIPLANVRYIYNLLALGIIFGFYVYSKFGIPLKIINVVVLICISASVSELSGHAELVWSLIFWLVFFVFFIINPKIKRIIITVVCIIFIPTLFILEKDYINNEYNRYVKNSPFWPDATRAWKWLDDNSSGDNISYVGRPVPLPLYGKSFKNNVFYTSINNVDPVKLHYFKNGRLIWDYNFEQTHKNLREPNNYRGNADFEVWLKNLKRRKADYLFVYSLHQTRNIEFSIEDRWASENPQYFNEVFRNKTVHIYKINL